MNKIPPDAKIASALSDAATIDAIKRAVAKRAGIPLPEMDSMRRASGGIRQLAMFLAWSATGASYTAVGRGFGGKDRTTVRHACRIYATLGLDAVSTDNLVASCVPCNASKGSKTLEEWRPN